LTERKNPDLARTKNLVSVLSEFHDYDFRKYKGEQSVQKIARNLVDYEAGKTILDTVMGIVKKKDERQIELF
jgi:DNA (cytosine-5)-methyltransferase 1